MVQRWKPSWVQGRMIPAGVHPIDGYVSAADHARIVAEATAEARAAERRHWEARFRNAEQAHATALAEEVQTHLDSLDILRAEHAAALAEAYTLMGAAVENVIEAEQPRTITADGPEPVSLDDMGTDGQKWAQAFVDRFGGDEGLMTGWFANAIEAGRTAGMASGYPIEQPNLIHDGEATPQVKPCSTCGEPVAYLTARPGWAGGWLHHPARPLDGHPAAIDGEATT